MTTAAAAQALDRRGFGGSAQLPKAARGLNGSAPGVATPVPGTGGATAAFLMHEDGLASAFAHQYKGRLLFSHGAGAWFEWDGSRWRRDDTRRAFEFCRQLVRTLNVTGSARWASANTAKGVESFARSDPAFAVSGRDFDADPWLLGTPGGTFDLRTMTMRAADPQDYITRQTAVAPSSNPRPVFDRFLNDVTCGDGGLAGYLQRMLGACLSGAISDHWLAFWYGPGANGKNTLGDLVLRILGDYAKAVPAQTLMTDAHGTRHPTEIANLRGLRFAVSSEIAEGEHWSEARLKELTGDAMLTGRFMRQDFFEFPRTHKHLVYGNHRPLLRIVDAAISRRLHVAPFNASFTVENSTLDPSMPDRLWAEAPQVLAWLIEGHEKWRQDGALLRCKAVDDCTADYLGSQATLDMWIEERIDTAFDDGRAGRDWPKSGELYADFSIWKKDRGEHPMSQTRWSEQMQRRFRIVSAAGRRVVGALLKSRFGGAG